MQILSFLKYQYTQIICSDHQHSGHESSRINLASILISINLYPSTALFSAILFALIINIQGMRVLVSTWQVYSYQLIYILPLPFSLPYYSLVLVLSLAFFSCSLSMVHDRFPSSNTHFLTSVSSIFPGLQHILIFSYHLNWLQTVHHNTRERANCLCFVLDSFTVQAATE